MSRSTLLPPGVDVAKTELTLEHESTPENTKSVQEVSKRQKDHSSSGRRSKTDIRYWETAIFQPTYTRNGTTRSVGEWAAKIQHLGRRETFGLGSANRTAASARAKQIYLCLQAAGWEETLAKFKAKAVGSRSPTTVGEFLTAVLAVSTRRPKTIEGYCRAFRTIIADSFQIDGGRAKFDYRNGGRARWLAQVEAVKLVEVTPAVIQKWKLGFLRSAGVDPLKQRAAKISVNSLIRQAKSLFAAGILKFVPFDSSGSVPFAGIKFEPRQSMRYRSGFDVVDVIRAAQNELSHEQL